MKLLSELERTAAALEAFQGVWALCGGVVASIYRETPRFTADIDFAITDLKGQSASDIAETTLKELGYAPAVGFVPDPTGASSEQVLALICGRTSNDERFVGVDFLLPTFPWVEAAIKRAQYNLIDYGFAKLPTITPEDLIIAKIYCIRSNSEDNRHTDDIRAILTEWNSIDREYLKSACNSLQVELPDWVLEKL